MLKLNKMILCQHCTLAQYGYLPCRFDIYYDMIEWHGYTVIGQANKIAHI